MIFVINNRLYFLILNRCRSQIKDQVEYSAKLTSAIPAGRVVVRAVAGARYIRKALNSNCEHDYYR